MSVRTWMVVAAIVLFLAFIGLKLFEPKKKDRASKEAWKQFYSARRRARKASDNADKARAWQEAADIALNDLRKPRLAAKLALRSEKLLPGVHAPVFDAVAQTLRKVGRYSALERYLWERLATAQGESWKRSFSQLVSLYEGPLRKENWAKALTRIHGQ